MNVSKQDVQVIDTADLNFGTATELTHVLNDQYTLTSYNEGEWVFRSITGWTAEGRPIVDLDKCSRFELVADIPEGADVDWILNTTMFEVMRRYAK